MMTDVTIPFWQQKSLKQFSKEEWESVCDGCGLCCLHKLEDEDDGQVYYTQIACRLLDDDSCRCQEYEQRTHHIPECTVLSPEYITEFHWLPPTCAYRLLAEDKPLPAWHPLVTGCAESVHEEGVSVKGKTLCETQIPEEDWQDYLIHWVE
ncbi:YcgN family cysteine cluster protein [Zooshikella sp. RANM57]|uniref:YcgN family cysteine cluster protein n=1 Tax=Zooshikella sp. RANM57 TaxID=3425863 RepID=UPI003D6F9BE3